MSHARRFLYLAFAALAVAAALLAGARDAHAHDVGVSQSEFVVEGAAVRAQIVFAARESRALVRGGTDDDLRDVVASGIAVTADGDACPGALAGSRAIESDGFAIDATFACPHAPRALAVTMYLLAELPRGHRHWARIDAGASSTQALLDAEHRDITLILPDVGSRVAPRAPAESPANIARSTFALGVQHILLGWDHLLFVFALLLVPQRLRAIVGVVTAFTIAHSITLALAVLGVVALPAWLVEPAIAASIAFVAFDNAAPRHLPRAAIAFAFGLVHGFGFAGALARLGLARDRVLPALVGFNAGVEAGQVAVVLALVPLLASLRRRGMMAPRPIRALSLLVGAVALALCAARFIIA